MFKPINLMVNFIASTKEIAYPPSEGTRLIFFPRHFMVDRDGLNIFGGPSDLGAYRSLMPTCSFNVAMLFNLKFRSQDFKRRLEVAYVEK